jgi:small subunit ribosomal protein S2
MPYVDGRFIGGSLTNFPEIRKRIEKYEHLISEKETGGLEKYTKKERMLIDKEIARLEHMFHGIVGMKKTPDAVFIVDSKKEKNALNEAKSKRVITMALMNSDCDINEVDHAIVGNDNQRGSIRLFLELVTDAYSKGKVTK